MKVSILLPVYNSETTIQETIDSILCQTYSDFELVIINDGSSDKSEQIIGQYSDKRIRYYKNEQNKGLIYTLNRGLDLCNGEYIARIDADDIMLPTRLEKQTNYMDTHPHIIASGSSTIRFDGIHKEKIYTPPLTHKEIQHKILLGSPIPHPSAIIRKEILKRNHIQFKADYLFAEDYKFWCDLMQYGELANLKEPLIRYRLSSTQISQKYRQQQMVTVAKIKREKITELLNKQGINYPKRFSITEIINLSHILPNNSIYSTLLFLFCLSLPNYNLKTITKFISSSIYLRKGFSFKYTIAFFIKTINKKALQKFNLNISFKPT